jgi:hypothetical protein
MRIIRLADIPVIVRIRRHDEVTVVVPTDIPASNVLDAARLVLSCEEFAELEATIAGTYPLAATHRR